MRILVAHNVSRARTGGMSRIMGFIHDRVAKDGHTVEEFTRDDAPGYARGRRSRFGFPWAIYQHARTAYRLGRGYDLINVHESAAAVVAGCKGSIGRPIVVVSSHGVEQRAWELALNELRLGRSGPSLKTRWVYPMTSLWQSRLALRRADHIFCLNFEDRDYIVRQFGRHHDAITRIFPGASQVFATEAVGRDYSRATNLLFAGTWRKNKGIEDLVPAFTELARRRPSLTLTVLGGLMPDADLVSDFPPDIRSRVLTVRATTEEVTTAAAFARADAFVLPSLFEGTPLVLIEAMASGLPVVTTATCGMRDVIRDGHNGLLVPIRSPAALVAATERLLADPGLRERVGRAANRDAAEHYTWDLVAAPVSATYTRLAASHLTRDLTSSSRPTSGAGR
jgi:glycosyltransferase involved in cell wall biosynthesis